MFAVNYKADVLSPGRTSASEAVLNSNGESKDVLRKIDKISNDVLSLNTTTSQASDPNEELSNIYRELTGVRGMALTVDFQQDDFIRDATLAQRGVCVPLTAKWLTERDVSPEIDFFSDIKSQWGREEIMHLAVETARTGNGSAVFNYLNSKNFAISPIEDESPKSAGLYSCFMEVDSHERHNIALHIKNDGSVYMFDPNYGEFRFPSLNDFNDFLTPYLKNAYSEDMSNENLSYVQYSRKIS